MKTTTKFLLGVLLTLVSTLLQAQQLAFPGAQGFGRYAKGARASANPTVYHVTNLNDTGNGSLRDAVSQPNRIVVFDVAGVINIKSKLVFKSNLYVAGQTAPGEGVTVYGYCTSCSGASNTIIRYMRFRMGVKGGDDDDDAAGAANGTNIIWDHCSFSWSRDELVSFNPDGKGDLGNLTVQNSILGQALLPHSGASLWQANNMTSYRNLFVDNSTRNVKVKGTNQYVNNIVYNWSNHAYEMGNGSSAESFANVVGNLFINGPKTSVSSGGFSGGNSNFHFYGADNWQDNNKDGIYNPTEYTGDGGSNRVSTPYDYPELDTWAGNELAEKLLPDVGASLPYRDLADCYMVEDVLSYGTRGRFITKEDELPFGIPTTWSWFSGTKKTDSDNDGMPDAWEDANGLNKNDAGDAVLKAANGYLNIENYINSITIADREYYLRPPYNIDATQRTTNSITISWSDYSDNETGFAVEVQRNDAWTEVGRTDANVTSFTITDLEEAKKYNVRVRAIGNNGGVVYSDYLTGTFSTKQEQQGIIDVNTYKADVTMGDEQTTWDYTTTEWKEEKAFQNNDNVLIASNTDKTVTISGDVQPGALVVKGTGNITLDGSIMGSGSVNKSGTGTLVLGDANTYSGATVLHEGTIEFSKLTKAGEPSSLGSSVADAQNWVFDGGTYKYTGGDAVTDRNAQLLDATTLNIAQSGKKITMNGSFEGTGDLTIDGSGQLLVNNTGVFKNTGSLIVKGGEVKLPNNLISEAGIGSSSKLVMQGGTFTTVNGTSSDLSYKFPIEAADGTTSNIHFDQRASISSTVSGSGTLVWDVMYVAEYIEGNWDDFTGTLIVKGIGNSGGSHFTLSKNKADDFGIRNGRLYLKGTASVSGGKNMTNRYLGGLSGDVGTFLSGFDIKSKNGKGTWYIGGANTDEVFKGIINNLSQRGQEGTTSIVKEGSGYWRLTGKNVYSGTTKVNAGKLIVNGQHTGAGAVTVASGATLAGKGTLAGTVTLNGTLQIGDTLATDKGLTFSGGLIIGSGAVLKLNEKMEEKTFYSGDIIQAFTGTVKSGTFASIYPATPGEGQTWDTTELYTKGILKVVGGSSQPDDPQPGDDPQPQSETKKVCIAWGNCIRTGGDTACTELVGNEADPSNNKGFSMHYTTVTDKYFARGEKMTYEFDGIQRTGIKLSNGAQVSIMVPDGYKVTKVTFWSTTTNNASNRTCYWKEVAGKTYTESDGQLLSLTATASAPSKAEFALNNVQKELTFTNAGEQQQVLVVLEYHTGGSDNPVPDDPIVDGINSAVVGADYQYFNLSGERVENPVHGIYIERTVTTDGKVFTRKVMK